MKVRGLIKCLLDYNLDAEFSVVADGQPVEEWSFTYGSSDGVTMRTAESVSIDHGEINAKDDGRSTVDTIVDNNKTEGTE